MLQVLAVGVDGHAQIHQTDGHPGEETDPDELQDRQDPAPDGNRQVQGRKLHDGQKQSKLPGERTSLERNELVAKSRTEPEQESADESIQDPKHRPGHRAGQTIR